MSTVKVVVDGKVQEVELPGELAAKEMGFLSTAEVDSAKARWQADERKKALADIEAIRAEAAQYKSKLEELDQKLPAKERDAQQLADRLTTLEATLTSERKARDEEKAQAEILGSLAGVALVDGAAELFDAYARKARVEKGYAMKDGTTGNIQQLRDQFLNSDLGKRLVLASDRGGTGTQPAAPGDAARILRDPKAAEEFVKAHGREAFSKLIQQATMAGIDAAKKR
jgi:Skp family chaperone for outer membrane proteins